MDLKRLIEARGMTPYQVAKKAGVSQGTVSIICRGDRSWKTLTFQTLEKIACGMGVEVLDLIENLTDEEKE